MCLGKRKLQTCQEGVIIKTRWEIGCLQNFGTYSYTRNDIRNTPDIILTETTEKGSSTGSAKLRLLTGRTWLQCCGLLLLLDDRWKDKPPRWEGRRGEGGRRREERRRKKEDEKRIEEKRRGRERNKDGNKEGI
eukprot:6979784-Heterocapsa_arctica.AAC.1